MPGIIKYKPVDEDKRGALIKSYYMALPAFYTGLFCKAFLCLHKAITDVVDISLYALKEGYCSEVDKGENIIRYFRFIPISLRNEINAAWKKLYVLLPGIALRNDKIKKLDAAIQSLLADDIVQLERRGR